MKMLFDTLLRLICHLSVIYFALLVLIYITQSRLLYFPDTYRPSADQALAQQLILWPGDGDAYRGLLSISPQTSKGTIIIFHGNAGSAWNRRFYLTPLLELGYRVILAEYPGYAGRAGQLTEAVLVDDAQKSIEAAYRQFGAPVILWGESLGAGVAAAAVATSRVPISALVLITPWDSLPRLAQSLYWYLPALWLTRDQYNNRANLQHFTGRIAVLIAEQDEIIPPHQAVSFYNDLSAQKKLWRFSAATHNSWPTNPKAHWWSEVARFISAPEPS